MKTELTIEESAKLVELGIYPKWAERIVKQGGIPIITLEHILEELLPKEIDGHPLDILWDSYCNEWQAVHIGLGNGCRDSELINALYRLLIKIIENKVYE